MFKILMLIIKSFFPAEFELLLSETENVGYDKGFEKGFTEAHTVLELPSWYREQRGY